MRENKKLKMLHYLIEQEKIPIYKVVEKNKDNSLLYACDQGYFEILKWLIDEKKVFENKIFRKNATTHNYNGYLALVVSGSERTEEIKLEILKYLIEQAKIPINDAINNYKYNILHIACDQGDFEILKWLIDGKEVFSKKILDKNPLNNFNRYYYDCKEINNYFELAIKSNNNKHKTELILYFIQNNHGFINKNNEAQYLPNDLGNIKMVSIDKYNKDVQSATKRTLNIGYVFFFVRYVLL